MLTTIAVLVIVMGLMSSLARRVRAQSAETVTKSLLRSLDLLMTQYQARYQQLPTIPVLLPDNLKESQLLEESALQGAALRNNREMLRVLRSQLGVAGAFADQPASIYNEQTLRDAWGTPIVFMSAFHPSIGTAPGNRFFFLSAGPDGHFLTRDDNLYSYESAVDKVDK